MRSVLISIKPKWCDLIASGKKTIEVRKTRPKLEAPFKCYIYCTKDKGISFWTGKRYAYADDRSHNLFDVCGNGKVIGEFVCDAIYDCLDVNMDDTCITVAEWLKYTKGCKGEVYGWNISDLKIYDKPRELKDFKKFYRECLYNDLGLAKRDCHECKIAECFMQRPPQSWCYVEETKNVD